MRTIHRYEASDIKTDNKVHTFIMAGITIAMIQLKGSSKETIMEDMKEAIAVFLNTADEMGIEIIDRDEVPAVFRAGFPDDSRR
jgi:hypothetical protein